MTITKSIPPKIMTSYMEDAWNILIVFIWIYF